MTTARLLPDAVGRRPLATPGTGHHARALPAAFAARPEYPAGDCRVAGTVRRAGDDVTPDTPLARRVWLVDETSRKVVRETWSDAATGEYLFDGVSGVPRYTVIAFDHEGQYRAAIADNLTAEPAP